MPIQLLITNIGFGFSLIVSLSLAILVFVRRPASKSAPNVVFFLFSLSVAVWIISYTLGINLYDPKLSRLAFMFNLVTTFTSVLTAHLILILTNRLEGQRHVIRVLYIIAGIITTYFICFPNSFMLLSNPALYLPNFLVPGPLYYIQDLFFLGVIIYFLYHLMVGYRHADYRKKNQLNYFIISFIYGYLISLVPEFLLYGVPVDPLPVAFFGLYTIPMAYAILKYDVLDITIFAKKALGYALSIAGVTLLILSTSYANTEIHVLVPDFPSWLLPFVSAIISVIVGVLVWHKVMEVNLLKYQFVDVVTHKFRTPLTYIKWSLDTLKDPDHTEEERRKAIDAMSDAHTRLFELTDSLIGLTSADNSQFMYAYTSESIGSLITEVVGSVTGRITDKGIIIQNEIPDIFPSIHIDRKKVLFAFQMIVDNAITYSSKGGKIRISAEQKGDFAFVSIADFGIGIVEADLKRLFLKFFRGSNAIHAHTEGLGIGLYLSRDILKRHGGDLFVHSDGAGKGSTFVFKIPLVK
jgi:signal transduction histidine kinase